MDKILHDDFALVIGVGKTFDKQDLLDSARNQDTIYEHQEEIDGSQTVRLYGDTAVVTAKLWIAGRNKSGGEPFDYKLWFSDTYVRTASGWRYAFGQAAQRLAPGS
jgi:ketosteroid isomerase-like protein